MIICAVITIKHTVIVGIAVVDIVAAAEHTAVVVRRTTGRVVG